MNEERDALDNFISKITEDDLLSVEPLFYRRVLTAYPLGVCVREGLQPDVNSDEVQGLATSSYRGHTNRASFL